MIKNAPEELLKLEHFPNDISILIGENGSGKSTLLNEISHHFLKNGKDVVAIANSIHDKFESGHKRFKTLRGRSGRKQTRHTIKNALQKIAESDIQRLKNASQALKYVGFDPVIGFQIIQISESYRETIMNSDLTSSEKERVLYLLEKTISISMPDEIIWLEVETYSFSEIEQSALTELFIWEAKLKQLKVITRIEVFLRKNRKSISMLNASSGELVLITSIVYLSTVITENTAILIDEPENSLHPKWQKEYARYLLDIFYFYQPKIIIATHSPLVVNGAELFIETAKIYKAHNFTFHLQHTDLLNVEEIFYKFFDVTTPQNRYLSDRLVRLLNLLSYKKLSLEAFKNEVSKIETNSYDPKQKIVLDSINQIAIDIESSNTNQNDIRQ